MVLIGERHSNGIIAAEQQNYGPHFDAINNRLRNLGLRTYTPEEIRRQIAQAEIDAYFRNDQDAMLSAVEAAGRELRAQGPDHGACDTQPDDERQPGHGEHAFHADRRREDHVGGRCALGLLRRRRRLADGADAGQRAGRRGGRHALFRLLPDRGRPAPQSRRRSRPFPFRASTMHSEGPCHEPTRTHRHLQILLGAALARGRRTASAQPTWGNPSPTAGGERRRRPTRRPTRRSTSR